MTANTSRAQSLRLAVVVSHPIQHFAPWHRMLAKLEDITLKVFFCCDWGVEKYFDPEFGTSFSWDTPLLDGYSHEFLPIKKRPNSLTYWAVDNPKAEEALSNFKPDVLQLFGYAYRTNWRVAAWARKNNVPVLLYSDSIINPRISIIKRLAKHRIIKHFYEKVDGALVVGDNNRRYHSSFGLPTERLFTGSLPIDYERLTSSVEPTRARCHVRAKFGIPDDAFVVLFCGKLSARKRPLDLVRAAHEITTNGRATWCLLVGEGDERLAIENFHQLNGTKTVLAGFINQSHIAEYYAASDLLVVPSEFDPHPLVITEASAFRLPTIVSDRVGCIGPNDTARPGVNALVYPCGDVPLLMNVIQRLLDDRKLYHAMSRAAEKIAQSQAISVATDQLAFAARQLRAIGQFDRGKVSTAPGNRN